MFLKWFFSKFFISLFINFEKKKWKTSPEFSFPRIKSQVAFQNSVALSIIGNLVSRGSNLSKFLMFNDTSKAKF